MTITKQPFFSVLRQIVAVAAVVMGALTSALSGIHLPPAVSSVLAAFGGVLLVVEHYVADPSTGSSSPTSPTARPQQPPAPPST